MNLVCWRNEVFVINIRDKETKSFFGRYKFAQIIYDRLSLSIGIATHAEFVVPFIRLGQIKIYKVELLSICRAKVIHHGYVIINSVSSIAIHYDAKFTSTPQQTDFLFRLSNEYSDKIKLHVLTKNKKWRSWCAVNFRQ